MKWFLYAFSLIGISIGYCSILYTTKTRSLEIVENFLEIIKSSLASGEDMVLAPGKVATFKCSGELRERINGG